jgi:nucleoside phosphorylase
MPLRLIAEELEIQLVGSVPARQLSKIAVIPTDDTSLQEVLRSLHDVERFTHRGRRYFRGWLPGGIGILISPVPRIGNIGAAAATTALVLDNDINKIFVVGLCGGVNPSRQTLADVVVSSDVIYYEPGLVGPDGGHQRMRISGTTSPSILALADELAREYTIPSEPQFRIHIGSIFSGEKIIRSTKVLSQILSHWSPNVVAVDMEGAGVFEAASSIGQDISIAIVRGVADFADGRKTDDKRAAAIQNTVSITLELIRRLQTRRK